MTARRRILVPVDFSAPSRAALERALSLSADTGCPIHLIHAIDYPTITEGPDLAARLRVEMRADAGRSLEAWSRELAARDADWSVELVEREPAAAIRAAAREGDTGWIVIGSNGRRGIERLLLGSVAERVVTSSTQPVYVTREDAAQAREPIRSILFATDFSRGAERLEEHVASLARHASAEVEVLHALWEPTSLFAPYAIAGSHADVEGELREAAERRMARVAERFAERGIPAKTTLALGPAPEAILERAESTGTQLIAMGTRGYSTMQRFLLGSVAHRVLRHAPCSVLVVNERSVERA